jgi:hypothetical protein
MVNTKLVTMNMDKSKEKILKRRAIIKGMTKSGLYRNIIKNYMDKKISL